MLKLRDKYSHIKEPRSIRDFMDRTCYEAGQLEEMEAEICYLKDMMARLVEHVADGNVEVVREVLGNNFLEIVKDDIGTD